MAEELLTKLTEKYKSASVAVGSKWMAREMTKGDDEENEFETYDVALLKIFFTDYAEEPAVEQLLPIVQVRIMRDEDKGYEEIFLILGTIGMGKAMEDELDLKFCETRINEFLEKFTAQFPDVVYRYEWYGEK